MPRSSRHKSHKQHKSISKEARDYTDSDEEEALKERKPREGPAVSSGIRVLKDSDSGEKRKVKDLLGPGNGDYSAEYGSSKRRKDRAGSTVGSDRWNGGDDERVEGLEDKEMKNDGFGLATESASKSMVTVDSRSKSSRKLESGGDRREDSLVSSLDNEEAKKGSAKVDSKRKSEKEGCRKEWLHSKDIREKERGSEREKKGQDGRCEKSVDIVGTNEISRKQGARMGEEESYYKKEVENTEFSAYAELFSPVLEKEYEKRVKKRIDGSGTKDVKDDVDDDRRLSREDHQRNGKYKDEKHKNDRHKDKHRDDSERDHRYKDDKYRDERSSRDRTTDRPDSKYSRDENKTSESRHKKAKLQENSFEGSSHTEDQGTRYKDYNGRKISPDDNEDYDDMKAQGAKELLSDVERNASSSSKLDSPGEKRRSKSRSHHSEAVDCRPSSNHGRNSPSSGTPAGQDTDRHEMKQSESVNRDSLPSERYRRSSTRDASERTSESQYIERPKQKTDSYSELHKQCMDLVGMEKDLSSWISTTKDVLKEQDSTEVRPLHCDNNLRALLFPESTETIFERSMALYKKQKEEMQVERPVLSAPDAALKKSYPVHDEEAAEGLEDFQENTEKVAKLPPSEENKEADSYVNHEEHQCDSPSGVVISDDSEVCEASKPELVECRVNLSRIPNSPGSTH
ncbi:uncharacterized protein [Aristolochia californica]|uniref:uncharacterized protein isoform X3 n=1 Tax=Aristolochia californica TaxID=171875 RepID=UPI0035D58FDC